MKLKNTMLVRVGTMVLLALLLGENAYGQRPSRSGMLESRVSSDPADLPCAGVTVLEEDFENGIPAGWTLIDGDAQAPRSELNLAAGWQLRADYDDTSNTVMVSPSWYENGGASNDWLILPQVTLGANPCMSWTAYSLDNFFLEAYEVRVSTTTNDTSAFNALPAADTVPLELPNKTIRAISLADYANQSVYLAFRQISDDKFALVLDDVRISNIQPLDIGISAVSYGSPSPGDSIVMTLSVSNYGADTVTSFTTCYSIDGGASNCSTVDSIVLPPNQTLAYEHPDTFVSDSMDAFYDLCAWTSAPNNAGDNDANNDTLCQKLEVGNPVGLPGSPEAGFELLVYPNPVEGGVLHIALTRVDQPQQMRMRLFSISGSLLMDREFRGHAGAAMEIDTGLLTKGLYLLEITGENGRRTHKITLQ